MTTLCFVTFSPLSDIAPELTAVIPKSRFASLAKLPIKKQKQSLLAEALVRLMLSELTDTPPEALQIVRTYGEKPRLTGFSLDFSLSHTDGAVAAICSDTPVGADIEVMREPRLKAAKRYFTQNELDFAEAAPDIHFWDLWTRKEALGKARGTGLSRALSDEDTLLPPLSGKLCTDHFRNYAVSVYSEGLPCISYITEESLYKHHNEEGLICH
ncbi:MAG: 4'-phosphopantetheinyl transferase superfamily protein [Oscillospiraceae bacterium]